MDALNQIPNYLIRGENWAAHYNLYNAYERLSSIPRAVGQSLFDWNENKHVSFNTVKLLYEAQASKQKLQFFHEFQADRVVVATRAYYKVLYGHFGDGVVSGFKENRYVCGERFRSLNCHEDFLQFMLFLRKMCLRVKVLLLTRGDHTPDVNPEIFDFVPNGYRLKAENDLERTHQVFDEYAGGFPDHAFRVRMEEMFDPQRNATLARNLLGFLDEDPSLPIRFTRMPGQ